MRFSTGDFDVQLDAQHVMRPGERLLWAARPDYKEFTKLQWQMVFFGLFWMAITVAVSSGFIFAMFFAKDAKEDFPLLLKPLLILFFIPFWLIGLYMLGGHKLVAKKQWKKKLYALTTEGILIRNGKSEVRLDHEAARNVQIDRLKNGLATVRFIGGTTSGPINVSFGKFSIQVPAGVRTENSDSNNRSMCFQAIADADAFVELTKKILAAKQKPQVT